jgi:hypothetical protein
VLVLLKEKLEILHELLQLFVLISFLIVVTIEQLNEYFVKQPNDHHVSHFQVLFRQQHLALKMIEVRFNYKITKKKN